MRRATHAAAPDIRGGARVYTPRLTRLPAVVDAVSSAGGCIREQELRLPTDHHFVTFICDQLGLVPQITSRKMFGEYAIYCGGKVFAFVCNNQMYLKPTVAGRAVLGEVVEGFPYPGAKPYFLIADGLEDREWLARLVEATVSDLPEPAARKPRRSKA